MHIIQGWFGGKGGDWVSINYIKRNGRTGRKIENGASSSTKFDILLIL